MKNFANGALLTRDFSYERNIMKSLEIFKAVFSSFAAHQTHILNLLKIDRPDPELPQFLNHKCSEA